MKPTTKRVFQLYQVVRATRYQVLHALFGTVSHCKHSPTCGSYFIRQVDKHGILVGTAKGFWRALRCW